MVEQRANLDYGRDDETPTDTGTVEGDGFTMTDTDLDRPGVERPAVDRAAEDVDFEPDDEDHDPDA